MKLIFFIRVIVTGSNWVLIQYTVRHDLGFNFHQWDSYYKMSISGQYLESQLECFGHLGVVFRQVGSVSLFGYIHLGKYFNN